MSYMHRLERIKLLEHKALLKYVGNIPFERVLEMLNEQDLNEYKELMK